MSLVLKLDHIYKDYITPKLIVPVLHDVCLHVEEGEYVAIMGPSGSGKSTLMNIIGCLDRPTKGTYELNGVNVLNKDDKTMASIRLNNLGFVFQNFELLSRQTALANVELPLVYAGVRKRERIQRAKQALTRVGLADRMNFTPAQLSGGQKQRVAIVRALIMHPEILLFDEVTAALDPEMVREVLDVILDLAKQQRTMLIVTHEMAFARAIADRVIFLDGGSIVEDSDPASFFTEPKTDRARKFLNTFEFEKVH